MSAARPLVPFVEIPDLVLVQGHGPGGGFPEQPISIKPFGVLVAIGVYVGAYLAIREGKRRGLDERELTSCLVWVVSFGFIGAHALDVLAYYPREVLADPLLLLRLWEGLSSFGGFIGACAGGFAWAALRRKKILPYADVFSSVFPVGWIFGRLGCTLAHDHPGIASQSLLAVRYPDGGRFDLGLLELLITLPLAALLISLWRKPRPLGFYSALVCLYYAPLRFSLDFLRARSPVYVSGELVEVDARYVGLTPAQWACVGMLLLGIGLALRARQERAARAAPATGLGA